MGKFPLHFYSQLCEIPPFTCHQFMRERRLAAFYIDALLSGLFVNILILLLGDDIGWYIGVPIWAVYMLFRDAFPNGQSIGKKIMKLQVVDNEGNNIAGQISKAAIRSLTLIPPIGLIEAIRLVLGKNRYGDIWAGTTVKKV